MIIVPDAIRSHYWRRGTWKPVLRVDGGLFITHLATCMNPDTAILSAYTFANGSVKKKGHRFYGATVERSLELFLAVTEER